jgi:hypothetical protein
MHLVVDIDQTIFPLIKAISTLPGGEDVAEEKCLEWDMLETFCKRPLPDMIHEAIQPDVSAAVGTYPHVLEVLETLAETNIDIALATHRERRHRDVTRVYLESQGLSGFPLYVDEELEKLSLLFPDGLIVDDAPHTMEKASRQGVHVTALAHRYNDKVALLHDIERGNDWLKLERIIRANLFL